LSLLTPRAREAPPGHDFADNVMHVDADAICPRCLCWIGATDIVRRTAYGLVQHEACPVTDESSAPLSVG
jgi:D-lyxose ketol-isomerase